MIMGPNGDCFAVARIFVLFCRHPFAGEASAEFSITSLLVNRPPEKSVRSGAIITLICGGEGLGALPRTPLRKLFENSFLRTFKNFQQRVVVTLCAVLFV